MRDEKRAVRDDAGDVAGDPGLEAARTSSRAPDPRSPGSPPSSSLPRPASFIAHPLRFWRRGEPFVWASGAALSLVLLATVLLVAVVMVNGLGVFWPAAIVEASLDDGRTVLGRQLRAETNPDTGVESVQFKTANRDFDPERMDFHWYPAKAIRQTILPPDVFALERTENGDFYGFLEQVSMPTLESPEPTTPEEQFRTGLAEVRRRYADEIRPIARQLSSLNWDLQRTRNAILKLEYRARQAALRDHPGEGASGGPSPQAGGSKSPPAGNDRLAELREAEVQIRKDSDRLVAQKGAMEAELRKNVARFRLASGQVRPIALVDVVRAYQPNSMSWTAKVKQYAAKVWELLSEEPRESNTEGGLFPAIFGTVMLVFLMSLTCFPLGVMAGIYLGEYAREGTLVRIVRVAVNNLAGIPSIVYGIFGLGFFVYGLGGVIDHWLFPERVEAGIPTYGTGGILWASMTLGILTVPVVIVATEESLRTIPRGFREGSYALGATKLQTLLRVLLPMASPGIMTGFILAMARAAGEVAPLMITGVVKLAPNLPLDGRPPFIHLDRKFMHLGFHVYDIGFQSPNVEATKPMVYVTTLLLVLIVLVMSSAAIVLRNRMRKRYQGRAI